MPATVSVLRNAAGRHCLWPARVAAPAGWDIVLAGGSAEECADYLNRCWTVALDDCGATGLDETGERTDLATRFELVARQCPDSVAVTAEQGRITYSELNRGADLVASALGTLGVRRGTVVAIVMPTSLPAVLSILACLKQGAAYLPVDPDYPADRIAYMLQNAAPVCAATIGKYDLPGQLAAVVLDPAGVPVAGMVPSDSSWSPAVRDHRAPAYVIYTSGSTGRPKGVVVEQRAVLSYLDWAARAYPGGRDCSLLHTPLSFDLSVTALFLPLLHGGCVHLGALAADDGLLTRLRERPVRMLKITPSHLPLLSILPPELSPQAQLVIGGEQLTGAALADWRSNRREVEVINEYGPTEATVGCCVFRLAATDRLPAGPLPIGCAISTCQLHVLDADLLPVPTGEVGELYIGGQGLARGYLGDASATAASFLANPFGPAGSVMYRTGDLVRADPSGNLEFVGRTDDQIKVRGFRVEPAEVEMALTRHPRVDRALVLKVAVGRRAKLAAYYSGDRTQPATPAELRRFVSDLLPSHMVPEAFLWMDSWPLTTHGKVDRSALPLPDFRASPAISGIEQAP